MIHVLFVPGMFGSTIEHVVRNYTTEYVPTNASIDKFGAMHTYAKEAHALNTNMLDQMFDRLDQTSITTPIYPFIDGSLSDIVKQRPTEFGLHNKSILMYAPHIAAAELNMLFQYHKISIGCGKKLNIFFSGAEQSAVKQWNSAYTSFDDMSPWEFREWFSLFYVKWVQEWIDSQHQVDSYFLKIKNTDVLETPATWFRAIIQHCGLTETPGLDEFASKWLDAQQYVLKEFKTLETIVYNTLSNQSVSWEPISIIGEAIVQQRLRAKGYEIRCDGLNTFPTDSTTLHNLLEKI